MDQINTQVFWHSWMGNTTLFHITVITHPDRIDVERQRLCRSVSTLLEGIRLVDSIILGVSQ